MTPRVLLIGRPNVGKSTLFNRILGKRKAIVEDRPGTTRDWQEALIQWRGRLFSLIDTGGLGSGHDTISSQIQEQITESASGADLVIFIGDAKQNLTSHDFSLADWIRKQGKPILWIINKVDNPREESATAEFYRLGGNRILTISALHGKGIADLLDEIVVQLPVEEQKVVQHQAIRIAIVGRPNVGKSTLVNQLIGKKRVLVDPAPGTTRDAVEISFEWKGNSCILVDTAGIRARSKRKTPIEIFSVSHTEQTIKSSDLIFFLLEAEAGVIRDDLKILQLIQSSAKSCLIFINKWDQIKKMRFSDAERVIRSKLPGLDYLPILPISALTGEGIHKIFDCTQAMINQLKVSIATSSFNDFLENVQTDAKAPSFPSRAPLKFYYGCQIKKNPATFQIVTNSPKSIPLNYQRWLEHQIRQKFELTYLPVRIKWKGRRS